MSGEYNSSTQRTSPWVTAGRVIFTLALIGCIAFIFSNSMKIASVSTVSSSRVLTLLQAALRRLGHPALAQRLTDHIVRKLAHFCEYMLEGFLLMLCMRVYTRQYIWHISVPMLGGVLTGSMLGATVVFTIPVAMGILEEKDRPVMAQGILCGIVTIPLGVLAGGLTAGFPIGMVLRNLIPIVIIAALIALGLWRAENAMVRGFEVFGKLVVAVVTVGLAAAIVEALTGFVIIPGMAPISEGFETVGTIAIVLAGAFPLVFVITKLLRKPLMAAGRWLGINDAAAAGLIASLANSIATFGMVKDMNRRGKVVNIAFAVSAAFVFGDHLGFTAGFAPEMIGPMIVGKLVGGVSAIAVAMWLTGKEEKS